MCGIAGFYHPQKNFLSEKNKWLSILKNMNHVQKHRGPDDEGTFLSSHCGLCHVRLSIIDLVTGSQPMRKIMQGKECVIVFNGEIYNMKELKEELKEELKKERKKEGIVFETSSDTEVILNGFFLHGIEYVKKLNGIFSIAFWDSSKDTLYLFRDRLGVKPLFYTVFDNTFVFASEMKGIFAYPKIHPKVDKEGLCEIFALGPAKSYGKGVFQNILEVLPGHCVQYSRNGIKTEPYWTLISYPHTDSFSQTLEKTTFLVEDAVKKQMLSDIPICTFLSGGLDSSLVTAICAKELKKEGKTLDTFSFDFEGNQKYFQSNAFQPSEDAPYAQKMAQFCQTNHKILTCNNQQQIQGLYHAVDARDLPCMADIESSMLYFCSQVRKYHKVALTGECADEIFGGYPWFHSKKAFETHAFPWSMNIEPRKMLLSQELLQILPLEEYAKKAYEKTIQETPILPGESTLEKRRREIAYLNLKWFMATLLNRMDRTSMAHGLEARVPFADHRIVEYIFNVPWEMKCQNGVVKGLLRQVAEQFLPQEIVYRKKSPYPKTYDPHYEGLLAKQLKEVLSDSHCPIGRFLDKRKVEEFLKYPSDYGKPWYGQLMAGPQMIAYLLQVNYWLEKYQIEIVGL